MASPPRGSSDTTPRDPKRLRVAFDGTPERRRTRANTTASTVRRPLRRQNAVVVEELHVGASAVAAAIKAAAAGDDTL